MSITQETRREAYESVDKEKRRELVYNTFLRYGPQSVEDVMKRLGTENPNTVAPRVTELKKAGLLAEAGRKKNKSKRSAAVFEATEKESRPRNGSSEERQRKTN